MFSTAQFFKLFYTAHILFDDAMKTNKETNKRGPNDFVNQFKEILNDSARYFPFCI